MVCNQNLRARVRAASRALFSLIAFVSFALVAPLARAQAVDVPYVPTPMNVVEAMLKLAQVGPADFVIDLGSGDGRIVIAAAKTYGARGFGVDLDGALVSQAQREAERQGVSDRVNFYTRNIFITEMGNATVVTSYLLPQVNIELTPRIFEQVRPGTRIVSHDFDFGSWKPDAHVRVAVPGKPYGPPTSEVYLWIVPANAAGRWQWRVANDGAGLDCEVTFDQTFQTLRGSARAEGRAARIENSTLRGDEITLAMVTELNGTPVRYDFSGRVAGDRIRGVVRIAGSRDEWPWEATRTSRGSIAIQSAATN